MADEPTPLDPTFAKADVDRMMEKVRNARLPPNEVMPGKGWEYGTDPDWLVKIQSTWANEWSYEAFEKQLQSFKHFRCNVDGTSVHFIHARSARPDAIPLILIHGWPSSFLEFGEVIDALTSPPEGTTAFHVIVPSLPGFGFSSPPQKPQTSKDIAHLFNKLMVESLGYDEYATSAGDWGTAVAIQMLDLYPTHARSGIFNMLFAKKPPVSLAAPLSLLSFIPFLPAKIVDYVQSFGLDDFERKGLQRTLDFRKEGTGYQRIQGTKPGTIGQALYDNPVGILAWIGEKFHDWSDPKAPAAPSRMTATHIINQVALYHLTGTIHTSCLPYKDFGENDGYLETLSKSTPVGYSVYPYELFHMPKTFYEASYNLVQYRRHKFGGHFAAVDNHEAYVDDVRSMFGANFPRA